MSKQLKINKHYINSLLAFEVEWSEALAELALDLRYSWNHASDEIWRQIDPDLWSLTHNPWCILQTVSRERIESILKDPAFHKKVNGLLESQKKRAEQPAWFQKTYPRSSLNSVAYFSMEFMLNEALPIYAGGLGNVAGDQLKAASDLGVPVIGIGLLYQQGYFRQVIDKYGEQHAVFPYNQPGQLPITPLRNDNGEWLRVKVDLPGNPVLLRAWQVKVGRTNLYLLDSNDVANFPIHRGITSELYGGGQEMRLQQEIVLGIGGWKLLAALGIQPEVCHLNEGHAAFAVLERAHAFMKKTGRPFNVALTATRSGNLFTTHTAVAAGFDVFPPYLIEQYLGSFAVNELGINTDDLLALGRQNPEDRTENFNMAYLAIRGSGAVNGVSSLHGKVSRRIFTSLYPKWPENEVPVKHITNGVHMSSWDSQAADDLWTEACGKERWRGTFETHEINIRKISDKRIWQMRNSARTKLVKFVREQLSRQLKSSGSSGEELESANNFFDPDILTIGFARRFATYKRPNLLLHDPARFLGILTNSRRPVQLIIAGKAHPADKAGGDLIRQWINFIKDTEARKFVIFLWDYDMYLTENLVQGVDVWLNTPRRPWEACGTSGMKVLVNGGINISELDGWWEEAYSPEIGWALGDGLEHGDDPNIDAEEAETLYTLLEQQVIPEFYNRNKMGMPAAWVKRIRESMARLTPKYSANRAVRNYTEQHYVPAAAAYNLRSKNKAEAAGKITEWLDDFSKKWNAIRFVDLKVETSNRQHNFEVHVYIGDIKKEELKAELYADEIDGFCSVRKEMKYLHLLPGSKNIHVYKTAVPAERAPEDYTPRVIPSFPGVNIPLETSQILWQK